MTTRRAAAVGETAGRFTSDVVLPDGTAVALRPAGAQDADRVAALIEQLSERSRYRRFLSTGSCDTRPYLADLGADGHVALVAEVGGELVGVGELLTTPAGDRGEVAFTLADAYQGRGLGTLLLEHLATVARSRGVRRLEATTLAGNGPMMSVFADSGFAVHRVTRAGVVEVTIDLGVEDDGAVPPVATTRGTPSPLAAVRALAVVCGIPALLVLGLLAALVSGAVQIVRDGTVPWFFVAAIVAASVHRAIVVPWTRRWGTLPNERSARLPGDEFVPRPGLRMTRAVTVDAPPVVVWSWLAQIGADRGGFYSYAWLENLAGCRLRNADRIHPQWQHRTVGEPVMLHPLHGIPVTRLDAPWSFALGGWYFVLEARPGGRTRLLARTRVPRGLPSWTYAVFLELAHFVMERRMLLGIRERAEAAAAEAHAAGRSGIAVTTGRAG